MSDRYELILTCPKSLESLLLEEASGLGLEEAGVEINRKVLADLAVNDPAAFTQLIEQAKAAR